MKNSLKRMGSPGVAKNDTQEVMEEYIMQCEKAIQTGKKTDLPKRLQAKLEELQRERENAALAQANSPPRSAEIEPTPSTTISTITIAKASEQKRKRIDKRTEAKEERRKRRQAKAQQGTIRSSGNSVGR